MSIDKRCDRCGEKIELGSPTGTVHYRAPLESPENYEICQGCAAELEAFWTLPSGEFAKDRLEKIRNQATGDY